MTRRRAERHGRWAEIAAGLWLRAKGYRIDATRYRTPLGEVDLIARKGDVLVFVEVKWRRSMAAAGEAIAPRQQLRIERAAAAYCARLSSEPQAIRFDAILFALDRPPCHLRAAWTPASVPR